MTAGPHLVLASASPARLATLRAAGLQPEVAVSGIDESDVIGEPGAIALELARRKARAVALSRTDRAYVIGCDSVLELDGASHGKPRTAEEAATRWRAMRGRTGLLHTGHWLISTPLDDSRESGALASTKVHFADISDAEVDAYIATGEPLEVAGAFTVDGLGGPFISGIEGDHHNVVGISLPLLRRLLLDLGVSWPELWRG